MNELVAQEENKILAELANDVESQAAAKEKVESLKVPDDKEPSNKAKGNRKS